MPSGGSGSHTRRRDALTGVIDNAVALVGGWMTEGTIHFYRSKGDKEQTHSLTKDTLLAAIRYFEVAKPVDKLLTGSRRGGKLEGEMSERAITDRVKVLGES